MVSSSGFLELIDVDKLVYTKAAKLTPLLDTDIFSDLEKNWIKENRRRAINRKTAAESRDRRKTEDKKLTSELRNLLRCKQQLIQLKQEFQDEINLYKSLGDELRIGCVAYQQLLGASL